MQTAKIQLEVGRARFPRVRVELSLDASVQAFWSLEKFIAMVRLKLDPGPEVH
jgi:hypothetical protein